MISENTSSTLLSSVRSLEDQESWRRFLETYEPLLARWLRARGVPSYAIPEVLGEIYLKLVNHLPKFVYDRGRRFRSWLKTVAKHTLIDIEKRVSNQRESQVDHSTLELQEMRFRSYRSEEFLDEFVEQMEQRLSTAVAIATKVQKRVAEKTWQAFYLTEVEENSCRDAALKLGLSEASVHVARFRVRRHIQEEVKRLEQKSSG